MDAALIAEYGERMQPKLYEPPAPFMRQLQQQCMSLKLLVKTKRSFLNQLHALNQLEEPDKVALKACKTFLKSIEKQIKGLEDQMQLLAEEYCRDLFTLLQTILGISKKSALELIIVSGGFKTLLQLNSSAPLSGFVPASMSPEHLSGDIRELVE